MTTTRPTTTAAEIDPKVAGALTAIEMLAASVGLSLVRCWSGAVQSSSAAMALSSLAITRWHRLAGLVATTVPPPLVAGFPRLRRPADPRVPRDAGHQFAKICEAEVLAVPAVVASLHAPEGPEGSYRGHSSLPRLRVWPLRRGGQWHTRLRFTKSASAGTTVLSWPVTTDTVKGRRAATRPGGEGPAS